jgi:hypothetical protein
MLNLTEAAQQAFGTSGADYRYRVEIRIPELFTFVSGQYPIGDAPNAVAHVDPRDEEIDPFTREPAVSEREIVFRANRAIHDLIAARPIVGKRVDVYVGTAELTHSDWVHEFRGVITAYKIHTDNTITLVTQNSRALLQSSELALDYVCTHPLEIMRRLYQRARIPVDLYNETTLDYRRYPEMSHWNLTRAGNDDGPPFNGRIANATPVWDLVVSLLRILGGTLRQDSLGRDEWIPWHQDRPVAKHFTKHEIQDFEVPDSGLIRNRINVAFAQGDTLNNEQFEHFFPLDDTASQVAHAFPGEASRVYEERIDSEWIRALGWYDLFLPGPDDDLGAPNNRTRLHLERAATAGCCGARSSVTYPDTARPTSIPASEIDQVTPDRLAYFMFEDGEIVECDGYVPFADVESDFKANNQDQYSVRTQLEQESLPQAVTEARVKYPNWTHYQIRTRGWGGTPYTEHPEDILRIDKRKVYDVTIPVAIAKRELQRHSFGAPLARFRAPLTAIALQLGDFITADSPNYVSGHRDGADSTVVWEIVGVRRDIQEANPGIEFKLCRVAQAEHAPIFLPPSVNIVGVVLNLSMMSTSGPRISESAEERISETVPSVAVVATGDNLGVIIEAGDFDSVGLSRPWDEMTIPSLTASRDIYLRYSWIDHSIVMNDVANGAAEPALRLGEIRLAKVVTNGSAEVSSIADQRGTRFYRGYDIVEGTIPGDAFELPSRLQRTSTANPFSELYSDTTEARTTDATTTTAMDWKPPAYSSGLLQVLIGASEVGGEAQRAAWKLSARIDRNNGNAAVVGLVTDFVSGAGTWVVTVDNATDTVRVRVTGDAGKTVVWTVSVLCSVADSSV